MKIVMLQDFFGLDQAYQENLLTQHYIRLGHEVVVISSTFENIFDYIHDNYDASKPAYEVDYFGAKIIRLPYQFKFKKKIRWQSGLQKIFDNEKPDVIYVHGLLVNLKDAVAYKKRNKNVKIVFDFHSDFSNVPGWFTQNITHKIFWRLFLQKYLGAIDKIFPIVPASAQFLNEVYGVPLNRMELLPLGCDYTKSKKILKEIKIQEERAKFGIKDTDKVIISGGKFNPLKRLDISIDVLKELNRKDVHLLLFGSSERGHEDYAEELKQNAKGLNVHFVGWLNNESILKLMAIADLALFPSSQSVLWQQAIGMHLPLIAGDSGGQDMSYLNQNNNVFKVESKDINALYFANYIRDLFNDSEKLERMKSGAEKTASEYLDYTIIANRTLEFI